MRIGAQLLKMNSIDTISSPHCYNKCMGHEMRICILIKGLRFPQTKGRSCNLHYQDRRLLFIYIYTLREIINLFPLCVCRKQFILQVSSFIIAVEEFVELSQQHFGMCFFNQFA